MKLKTYQWVKLGLVMVTAMAMGQAIVLENYGLGIAAVTVVSLVLLLLRRRVKEIIADERDYAIGGKSALLAMQIYSWFAVILMLILYSQRRLNPSYELIAFTLAYSTCFLMLLYSLIFKYKKH